MHWVCIRTQVWVQLFFIQIIGGVLRFAWWPRLLVLRRLANIPLSISVSVTWWFLSLHLFSLAEIYWAVSQRTRCCWAHLCWWCTTSLSLSLLLLIYGLPNSWLGNWLRQLVLGSSRLCTKIWTRRWTSTRLFFGFCSLSRFVYLLDINPRSLNNPTFLVLKLPWRSLLNLLRNCSLLISILMTRFVLNCIWIHHLFLKLYLAC